MLVTAIKGFNREWTSVRKLRDFENQVIGWFFEAECGTVRKFPDSHWEDAHGAAIRAMEGHRCGNG